MKQVNELQLGKAGEYLVCADLILQGYVAFLSEQGLHYDVVVDLGGRLIRIQVKTTKTYKAIPKRKTYTPAYLFNARRCGKGGRQSYLNSDIDIMAFVCLEDNLIGYMPIKNVKQTLHFRSKKYPPQNKRNDTRYIEDFNFEKALNGIS
jgi:hypothetical protein